MKSEKTKTPHTFILKKSQTNKDQQRDTLPNIDFEQHQALFLTKTKHKNVQSTQKTELFGQDLGENATPSDYFSKCFNFHSENDTRINFDSFTDIDRELDHLLQDSYNLKKNTDLKNYSKRTSINDNTNTNCHMDRNTLDKNDLILLLESDLQTKPLTQSAFPDQNIMNSDIQFEESAKPQIITETTDERSLNVSNSDDKLSLRESFISFLGDQTKDLPDPKKEFLKKEIPELIQKAKKQKFKNFTSSKIFINLQIQYTTKIKNHSKD